MSTLCRKRRFISLLSTNTTMIHRKNGSNNSPKRRAGQYFYENHNLLATESLPRFLYWMVADCCVPWPTVAGSVQSRNRSLSHSKLFDICLHAAFQIFSSGLQAYPQRVQISPWVCQSFVPLQTPSSQSVSSQRN
jgi:hypothetical protein